MNKILIKLILAFSIVLMNINVCFPSDIDCSDAEKNTVSKEASSNKRTDASSQESHHCICTLTCHDLFINLYKTAPQNCVVGFFDQQFFNKSFFYPQVFLSLDKPPLV